MGKRDSNFIDTAWEKRSCLKPFNLNGCHLLIVGTITSPKGQEAGFFYTSKTNRLWELLDQVLPNDQDVSLAAKQAYLADHPNDPKTLEDMKEKLKANGIGFCDIYQSCYFKKKDSASDQQIASKKDGVHGSKIARDDMKKAWKNPQIVRIFLTSAFTRDVGVANDLWNKEDVVGEKDKVIQLLSPSKALALTGKTPQDVEKDWKQKFGQAFHCHKTLKTP